MYRLEGPSLNRVLIETSVAYGSLVVIGALLGNPAFNGSVIHPFLFVVLFMAIRYSLRDGVVAAVVAIILLWFGSIYRGYGVDVALPNDRESMFLFVCGSLGVGMVTDATRKKLQGLRLTVAEQGEHIFHLAEKSQVLDVANRELRKRIVGEEATLSTFQNVAQRLAIAKLEDVYSAILDLVVQYLGAEQCSIYLLEDKLLRLTEERGPQQTPPDERVVTLGFDLLSRAVTERRLVSFKDLRTSPVGTPHLLAVPIRASGDANVIGVLSIERLPFVKFTVTNTRLLTVIADWAGEAIYSARHGARFKAVEEMMTDCLTPHFFKRRVREEMLRARRSQQFNFGVSVLVIDQPQERADQELVERAVSMILALNLQETDVIGHLRDGAFGIVLLHLKPGSAEVVHGRLAEQLSLCLPLWVPVPRLRIRIGHCAYGATEDVDLFIRNAEVSGTPVDFEDINPVDRATTARNAGFQVGLLLADKQWREAIILLQKAINRNPLDSELRHQIIQAYLATRGSADFAEALKEYAIIQNRQSATVVHDAASP